MQKQIMGYMMMVVIGALAYYITQKLGEWLQDPALIFTLGIIIGAFEAAAYKWIRYTYKVPEDLPDPDLTPENHVKAAVSILTENIPKIDPAKLPIDPTKE